MFLVEDEDVVWVNISIADQGNLIYKVLYISGPVISKATVIDVPSFTPVTYKSWNVDLLPLVFHSSKNLSMSSNQ